MTYVLNRFRLDGQEAEIHRGLGLAERNAIKRFGAADEAVGAAILLASDASSDDNPNSVNRP